MKYLSLPHNSNYLEVNIKSIIKAFMLFSLFLSGVALADTSGGVFDFTLDQSTGEHYLKIGYSWARIVFFVMALVGLAWAATIFFGRNKGEGWQWLMLYMIILILSPRLVAWLSEYFGFGTGWLSSGPFAN